MLEVLFRLFVAGGLMVGSAQLPLLIAGQPVPQGALRGVEETGLLPVQDLQAPNRHVA